MARTLCLFFALLFSIQAIAVEKCNRHFLKLYIDTHREEFSGYEKTVLTLFYPRIKARINQKLKAFCNENTCDLAALTDIQVGTIVAETVEETLSGFNQFKAYATITGIMTSTALVSTWATSHLPDNAKFITLFISQLTTLGIYVFGSPIWDPIASRFRRWAFESGNRVGRVGEIVHENVNVAKKMFEAMWYRTQAYLSQNAQMSRNVFDVYISLTQMNWVDAQKLVTEGKLNEAAAQLAATMVRLRTRYGDIPVDLPYLNDEFNAHFALPLAEQGLALDMADMRERVWIRIKLLDPNAEKDELEYKKLINTWLDDDLQNFIDVLFPPPVQEIP